MFSSHLLFFSRFCKNSILVFTEWVSGLFFFVMFFAMTAAAGSAAREIFGVNYWLGVAAILIVCAFIILHGMKAVEIVSIILVPLLILGITAIGVRAGDETIEVVDKGGSIALYRFRCDPAVQCDG